MKNMSKKLLCLLLVAIMVLSAVPFGAFAAKVEYAVCVYITRLDGTEDFVFSNKDISATDFDTTDLSTARTALKAAGMEDFLTGYTINDMKAAGECVNIYVTEGESAAEQNVADEVPAAKKGNATDHNFNRIANKGDENGHFLKCTDEGCDEVILVEHTYNANGYCTVCSYEKPAADKADTSKPDSDKADTSKPDTSKPDSDKADTSKPDTSKPDSDKVDTSKPDTSKPDTDKVDTNKPADTTDKYADYKILVKKMARAIDCYAEGAVLNMTKAEAEYYVKAGYDGAMELLARLSGKGGYEDYQSCYNQLRKTPKAFGSIWLDTVMNNTICISAAGLMEDDAGSTKPTTPSTPTDASDYITNGKVDPDKIPNGYVFVSIGNDLEGGWLVQKRVGEYYTTGRLNLDDEWGTKYHYMMITDANGVKEARRVNFGSRDNDAKMKSTDYWVKIVGDNKEVKIVFMKSPSSNTQTSRPYATEYYHANTRLGYLPTLPTGYTAWYVDGKEITEQSYYKWEKETIYAFPGNGEGGGRVHLFIYNKDLELVKNVDVTDNVQESNGTLSMTSVKKVVEYQTGKKNPSMDGLFTEDGWAYYLNNKRSTKYADNSLNVGSYAEREGTQNVYVVMTNVSGSSNADTSNPKTGDNAMIGTAFFVMAVSVMGLATVCYLKKKELF